MVIAYRASAVCCCRVLLRYGPSTAAAAYFRSGLPNYYFSRLPAERRLWVASTTRAAMPASASLPQVRGS